MAMAIEMVSLMRAACIGGKFRRASGHQEAPVTEERVTAAEEVEVRQMYDDQRRSGMTTVEACRVVEIMRSGRCKIMVVAAEQNNFAVTIRGGYQSRMDGDDVAGRTSWGPWHCPISFFLKTDVGLKIEARNFGKV